jgi:hypothetical protein
MMKRVAAPEALRREWEARGKKRVRDLEMELVRARVLLKKHHKDAPAPCVTCGATKVAPGWVIGEGGSLPAPTAAWLEELVVRVRHATQGTPFVDPAALEGFVRQLAAAAGLEPPDLTPRDVDVAIDRTRGSAIVPHHAPLSVVKPP